MTKIWLLVAFLHMPNMPSVKHQAYLYPTEHKCYTELAEFLNIYERKSEEYKKNVSVDAHCLEFESFPIANLGS
tara:strand:- start:81 stop:302 length:222 start_codon:yes stop_codon:yes gene_type:complete